jgi:glycosyltransferase involved in cell wall biosynthesis
MTDQREGRDARGPALQVITSRDRRGAQLFATDLEAALLARGRSVRTVALTSNTGGDDALHVPALGSSRFDPRGLRALRQEAKASSVVVGHGSATLLAGVIATAGAAPPFVYRIIGDPRFWASTPARKLRIGLLLRRATRIVALWPDAARCLVDLHGINPDRMRVIPNGVPAERFPPVNAAGRAAARVELGLDPDTALVVYIGALTPEKNVAAAVRAIGSLSGLHLLVVGAGHERMELERLARETAPGRVHFLGTTARPSLPLAAADVLVLPSLTEGLPAVLIEAGLSGVPAVASDVGGVREILVPGESGLLVPAGDVERLAAGMRAALTDRSELGAAARARCLDRFEIGVVAEPWDQLLAEFVP